MNEQKPTPGTMEWVEEILSYHILRDDQIAKYQKLRFASYAFCSVLFDACPDSEDRKAAFRHFRECLMNAYCSIKLDGLV